MGSFGENGKKFTKQRQTVDSVAVLSVGIANVSELAFRHEWSLLEDELLKQSEKLNRACL